MIWKSAICSPFPDSEANARQPTEQIKGLKDALYFQPIDIEVVTLGEETMLVEGHAVSVLCQRYDGRVQILEARYSLRDPFAASVLPDRIKIQEAMQSRYIPENFRQNGRFEEYSILLVLEAKPSPEKWIEKNSLAITNFIRSQREVFDTEEINETLSSRTRYSTREIALADWEGAVMIAPKADFDSDIALLKLGNYQILRYRMLDQSIHRGDARQDQRALLPQTRTAAPYARAHPPDRVALSAGDDRFRARRAEPAPDRRLVYRQTVRSDPERILSAGMVGKCPHQTG